MAYTKQEFVHGQTLTANHLNHIEDGVAQLDTTVYNVGEQVEKVATDVSNLNSITNSLITDVGKDKATANDSFSNAIKGVASGSAIVLNNVSPIPHRPIIKVNAVADPKSVTVLCGGKNLSPVDSVTFINNTTISFDPPLPAGTYTLSANIVSTDTDRNNNGVTLLRGASAAMFFAVTRANAQHTFTTEFPVTAMNVCASYNQVDGEGDTATWSNIQIETGDTPTGFEEPHPLVEYNVSEDGYVENAVSVHPSMTIVSDNETAALSVEYNRDATALIADLFARVHALENKT